MFEKGIYVYLPKHKNKVNQIMLSQKNINKKKNIFYYISSV